jgi:hypothetical protein
LLKLRRDSDAHFVSYQQVPDGEPVAFFFYVHRRMAMAKIIEFHIPVKFQKKVKWVPSEERGRLIEFPIVIKKSAKVLSTLNHASTVMGLAEDSAFS